MVGGLAYLLLLNCFVLMLFGFFGHCKQLTTYVVMSMCFSAPGNWALTLRAFPELQSCAPVVSLCFVALLILGLNADLLYIMLHGPVLSFYCTLRNIWTEKVPASVASVAAPVLTCWILVFLVLEKQPYFQLVFFSVGRASIFTFVGGLIGLHCCAGLTLNITPSPPSWKSFLGKPPVNTAYYTCYRGALGAMS